MTGVIVVLPKIDDAKKMKNLLVRNGISVAGACTTGAQAIALADNLNDGIILCGYKLADMIYSQLHEYLPQGFEMLLIGPLCGLGDMNITSAALMAACALLLLVCTRMASHRL